MLVLAVIVTTKGRNVLVPVALIPSAMPLRMSTIHVAVKGFGHYTPELTVYSDAHTMDTHTHTEKLTHTLQTNYRIIQWLLI